MFSLCLNLLKTFFLSQPLTMSDGFLHGQTIFLNLVLTKPYSSYKFPKCWTTPLKFFLYYLTINIVSFALTFSEGYITYIYFTVSPSFPLSLSFFSPQYGANHLSLFELLNCNVKHNSNPCNGEDDPVPHWLAVYQYLQLITSSHQLASLSLVCLTANFIDGAILHKTGKWVSSIFCSNLV